VKSYRPLSEKIPVAQTKEHMVQATSLRLPGKQFSFDEKMKKRN
jgi:hypothetical protein